MASTPLVCFILGLGSKAFTGVNILVLFLGIYLVLFPAYKKYPVTNKFEKSRWLYLAGIFLLLLLFVFIFQLNNFKNFGLYEQDFYHIAPVFDWKISNLAGAMRYQLFDNFSPESLPNIFTYLVAFLGIKINGLQGIYLLSSFIPTASAFLIYLVLQKCLKWEIPALLGAILFIFYPPIKFPQLLFYSLHVEMGLLCFLIGVLAFLNHRGMIFDLFMCITMLFMKEFAPLFLLLPLLLYPISGKMPFFAWKKHLLRVIFIITGVVLSSSVQLTGMKLLSNFKFLLYMPLAIITSFRDGAIHTVFKSFANNFVNVFQYPKKEAILWLLSVFIFLTVFLILLFKKKWDAGGIQQLQIKNIFINFKITADKALINAVGYVLISLVLLLVAYSGYQNVWFDTNQTSQAWVHIVSVFPVTLLFSSGLMLVISLFNKKILQRIVIIFAVAYIAFLSADRIFIQNELGKIWKKQQWLWTNVLAMTDQLSDDMKINVILSNEDVIKQTNWDDYYFLTFDHDLIYNILVKPEQWTDLPKINFHYAGIQNNMPNQEQPMITISMIDGFLVKVKEESTGNKFEVNQQGLLRIEEVEKKNGYYLVFNDCLSGLSIYEALGRLK